MPNQSDSVNIEQLRAQLDAIYTPTEQTFEAAHMVVHYPEFKKPAFNDFAVSELTERAKSHSPNHMAEKAERIAIFGDYMRRLRTHRVRSV